MTSPVSPAKFAHVVLKTSRIKEMVDWCVQVLGGRPVFVNETKACLAHRDGGSEPADAAADDKCPHDASTHMRHMRVPE